MADFAQTVSNTVNIFGMSPPNLWNDMDWGDNWGASEDVATSFEKWLASESITLSDAVSKEVLFTVYNDLTFDLDLDICKRYEEWCKVWTNPSTNGADAVYDEFTKIGN